MERDTQKILVTLGALIREKRKAQGLSSTELARRLGMKSPAHLTRIERGECEPKIFTLHSIAGELDIPSVNALINEALRRMGDPELPIASEKLMADE